MMILVFKKIRKSNGEKKYLTKNNIFSLPNVVFYENKKNLKL